MVLLRTEYDGDLGSPALIMVAGTLRSRKMTKEHVTGATFAEILSALLSVHVFEQASWLRLAFHDL